MRIGYWSSDVCSSDLLPGRMSRRHKKPYLSAKSVTYWRRQGIVAARFREQGWANDEVAAGGRPACRRARFRCVGGGGRRGGGRGGREGVGTGQRGGVGVHRGGRRVRRKKKKKV